MSINEMENKIQKYNLILNIIKWSLILLGFGTLVNFLNEINEILMIIVSIIIFFSYLFLQHEINFLKSGIESTKDYLKRTYEKKE